MESSLPTYTAIHNPEMFSDIQDVIEKKHLLTHPFYQAWQEGDLSHDEMVTYFHQYAYFEAMFPTLMSRMHQNIADREIRKKIVVALSKEEGPDGDHMNEFHDVLNHFGIDNDNLNAPTEQTDKLLKTMRGLASTGKTELGVAAMVAYKWQIPNIAATKKKGLMAFYDVPEELLTFYETHAGLDWSWHDMLDSLAKKNRKLVPIAADDACTCMWEFLDGVTPARLAS